MSGLDRLSASGFDTDDRRIQGLLRLKVEASGRGWSLIDEVTPVAVRRSAGPVETDWQLIAAKVKDGQLWCRVVHFADGEWERKNLKVEDLGLFARDVPALRRELHETSMGLLGSPEVITSVSSGFQAGALFLQQDLRNESALDLEGMWFRLESDLQPIEMIFDTATTIREAIRTDGIVSPVSLRSLTNFSGRLSEDQKRKLVMARALCAELERRAVERCETAKVEPLKARRLKLDRMIQALTQSNR